MKTKNYARRDGFSFSKLITDIAIFAFYGVINIPFLFRRLIAGFRSSFAE